MRNLIKFALVLTSSFTFTLLSCKQPMEQNDKVVDQKKSDLQVDALPNKIVDKKVLVGKWVRTDAEYEIEISAVQDDGNLTAGYFNPKSINVSKAMWNIDNGLLKIYVELKDENYPGSNYKLNYIQEKDAFFGEYFQAVEGTTYDVAFSRIK